MANPQPENGLTGYAHDLFLAIAGAGFTALERGVIDGVTYYTYGAGKTKAQINVDDIRGVICRSGPPKQPVRVLAALNGLLARNVIYKQALPDGSYLLGIQKDYEKWTSPYKMHDSLQEININNINTSSIDPDKMYAPEALLAYAQSKSKFTHGVMSYRVELKAAKLLFNKLRLLTRNPKDAYNLITDYIDENEWMRQNVRMQFTFMSSRFEAWRSQIPRKPREIRENEEATGKRYRYNVKLKQWQQT